MLVTVGALADFAAPLVAQRLFRATAGISAEGAGPLCGRDDSIVRRRDTLYCAGIESDNIS